MHSFLTPAALISTALFSLGARAQYTASSINITSVPIGTRTQWCQSQLTSCPLLCLQLPGESSTTEANDCDPTNLTFDCICGNGQSPNASEYSQTLPYFICTEYGNECVAACNADTACQSSCRDNHPCGAQDPTRVNVTSTSTSMTATGTAATNSAGVVYTGLGGAATTTTPASSTGGGSKSGSQAALDIGRSYGLAIVFSGIFAGFALIM